VGDKQRQPGLKIWYGKSSLRVSSSKRKGQNVEDHLSVGKKYQSISYISTPMSRAGRKSPNIYTIKR
jgi:hypothetical protein